MARSGKHDPLDRFRFRVYVLTPAGKEFARGGFTECSSPSVNIAFREYKEGGSHMNPKLLNDGATFKAITLRRGVISRPGSADFAKWVADVFALIKDGQGPSYRRTIVIEHLDRSGAMIRRYALHNCVPTAYEPASDFSALDDAGYSYETLTFQYEGFAEESSDPDSEWAKSLVNKIFG